MIRHRSPFLTFVEIHSMLLLEEQKMEQTQNHLAHAFHADHYSSHLNVNINHSTRSSNSTHMNREEQNNF